jgi:hypothetical protein
VDFLYIHSGLKYVTATVYVVFIHTNLKAPFLSEQLKTINLNIDVEIVHFPYKVWASITHKSNKEELVIIFFYSFTVHL